MALAGAVVPAAGAGRRLGGSKALLELGGRPLVVRVVEALAGGGADPVVVVTGAEGKAVAEAARRAGGLPVPNPYWRHGQTGSLQVGLRALPPDIRGFLIHPVDHAFTTPQDVSTLLEAFAQQDDPLQAVLRPVHGDSFGHPVLFGRGLLREFLELDPDRPGNMVYRRHRERAVLVPVSNPHLARDLDTPEDLERARRLLEEDG